MEHFLGYRPYEKAPEIWKPISVGIEKMDKQARSPSLQVG
jgi:hypothetical protein